MKKFFELSYDEQWLLCYISSQQNQEIVLPPSGKERMQGSGHPTPDLDTETLYPFLCDATKKSLNFNNFDEKFENFNNIIDEFIKNKIESGKIKPIIDSKFPLSETEAAFNYYKKGRSRGKVLLTV